jgi:hypothetical protein
MAQFTGPGVNDPPVTTPIAALVPRGTATYGNQSDPIAGEIQRVIADTELALAPTWMLFFAELVRAIEAGVTPALGTLYADLTPAATVIPNLSLIEENGTLGLLLNRATTTISPAQYGGAYPPDGFRFTIMFINDATDGRLVAWDPLYLGVVDTDGTPDALNLFSFITLPAGAGFVLSCPPVLGVL